MKLTEIRTMEKPTADELEALSAQLLTWANQMRREEHKPEVVELKVIK